MKRWIFAVMALVMVEAVGAKAAGPTESLRQEVRASAPEGMERTLVVVEKGQLYNLAKSFRGPWRDFRLNTVQASTITYRIGYRYDERKVDRKYARGFGVKENLTLVCQDGSTKFYYLHTLERPNNCGVFVVERAKE